MTTTTNSLPDELLYDVADHAYDMAYRAHAKHTNDLRMYGYTLLSHEVAAGAQMSDLTYYALVTAQYAIGTIHDAYKVRSGGKTIDATRIQRYVDLFVDEFVQVYTGLE